MDLLALSWVALFLLLRFGWGSMRWAFFCSFAWVMAMGCIFEMIWKGFQDEI
jgi:hypothetical protein